MAQFEPFKNEVEKLGVQAVFIAAEKRTGLFKPEKYLAAHPAPFPFLLDEDRRVTKAYGVYQALRKDAINIARPATFLVDRAGVVRFIYVGANQTDRAELGIVLAEAKRLV
jgi:peroxiredoxin